MPMSVSLRSNLTLMMAQKRQPKIDIDPLLPSQLAMPVTLGIYTIISRACRQVKATSLQETMQALEAQAYFAACKQLYICMEPEERARLGTLGEVAARTVLVPDNLAQALRSTLEIKTHVGPVKIKHNILLFKRWLYMGLERFPGSVFRNCDDHQLIWRDYESKDWIDDQLKPFSRNENVFGEECRRFIQRLDVPDRDPIYEILNVGMARYGDQEMLKSFNRYYDLFTNTYSVIIEAVVRCIDVSSP